MGMELSHTFTVPVDVERTWEHFGDLAALAECFPGASVTSMEGDTFQGTCKVKLGPIALVYAGTGTFTERDEDKHRFVVEAKGRDKRGNGTAGALVTVEMAEAGAATEVRVHTDLTVTGKPAQFGRGVMQEVSDKLLGQFVGCLEQRLGDEGSDRGEAAPEEPVPEAVRTDAAPQHSDDALDLGAVVLPTLAKRYWRAGLAAVVAVAVVIWVVRRLT